MNEEQIGEIFANLKVSCDDAADAINAIIELSKCCTEHFTERMRAIQLEFLDDEEVCHEKMDELMCETLRNLGYEDCIDIFEETPKWYS